MRILQVLTRARPVSQGAICNINTLVVVVPQLQSISFTVICMNDVFPERLLQAMWPSIAHSADQELGERYAVFQEENLRQRTNKRCLV